MPARLIQDQTLIDIAEAVKNKKLAIDNQDGEQDLDPTEISRDTVLGGDLPEYIASIDEDILHYVSEYLSPITVTPTTATQTITPPTNEGYSTITVEPIPNQREIIDKVIDTSEGTTSITIDAGYYPESFKVSIKESEPEPESDSSEEEPTT